MKTNWQIWYLAYKKLFIFFGVAALIALAIILWWLFHPVYDPVPANIRHQVSFAVLYPNGNGISLDDWQYSNNQQILNFTAKDSNSSINFTEQETPLAYLNDIGAYDRFIGSLKPLANFNTKLGTVSLTTFVFAGDYQPYGTTAILNAQGTLLVSSSK